ncbi:MAG: PfkB family carbohydrate kinase [Pseudomonadales bacterium]
MLGAIAWDTIATTHTRLRNSTELNIKVDSVQSGLGGCAANIVYSLTLTGRGAACIAPLGADDLDRLPANARDHALLTPGPVARAFIFTDQAGDQRTYFAPGARPPDDAWAEHLSHQPPPHWLIQAPLEPALMLTGLRWAHAANASVVWCPGQYCDQITTDELIECLTLVDILVLNASEAETLASKAEQQLTTVPWRIVTAGAADILCIHQGRQAAVAVPAAEVIDPTGCGDAFVAGVVSTLSEHTTDNLDHTLMQQAIANGIRLAQACLAVSGCQNHRI